MRGVFVAAGDGREIKEIAIKVRPGRIHMLARNPGFRRERIKNLDVFRKKT